MMQPVLDHAAAFLAASALRATVVLLAAGAADLALRRRGSASARHLVWSLAVAAVLLVPALSAVVPGWSLPAARAVSLAPAPAPVSETVAAPSATVDRVALPAAGTSIPAARAEVDLPSLAMAIYLAGIVLLLARLAVQRRALARIARGAEPVADAEVVAQLGRLAREMGITRPVALLRLADGASPMTWGIRRPAVAIPAAVAEWPAARREPVLRHELAHVARRDCLTQALASLACALYWFHPGAWVAARRMRLERELACDDRVLAAGARPSGYARELLEMANALARSASPALAVSMASRPNLETRLRAAIDPARVRTEPGRRVRLGAGVLAAGIVATVSAAQAATPAPVTPPASPAIHTQRPVAPRAADAAAPSPVSTAEDRTVAAGTSGSDAAAPASAAQEELRGEWRIDPSGQSGMVQLSMVAGGNTTGLPVPRSRLEGLAESGSTRFQVRGEAGVVEFTGSMNGGHGTGSFRFTPDRGFAAQLTRRGLEAPSTYDQMRMTISGATLAGADALLAALPTRPGTQDLTRLFTHSIAPDDIRGIVAAGYRDITAEQVVRLKSHGIDAALLGEYQRQGDASLAPEMVIRMHNHGVTPEDVRAAGERAGRPVDPQMIIYGKRHGAKKWN